MKLSRLEDLTESLSMDKARNHLIEKIMHITLDILYLLTGEDYVVLKMSGGRVTHSSSPMVSGGFCRNRIPDIDPHTKEADRINDEKILELTNTINQLLTGELPIGCQDVTVYFSMEDREDLERLSAPPMDVMSADQKPFASPGGSKNEDFSKKSLSANSEEDRALPFESELPKSTPGTQTLVVKQEETYEIVDEETTCEHSSDDGTGTSSNRSSPEKHSCPPLPKESSENDCKIKQCDEFHDFKIEIKSLQDGEEMRKWSDVQYREEDLPKNWKRGWTSVMEEVKKTYWQQPEKDSSPEEGRGLQSRVKCLPLSVIKEDQEEIVDLQRNTAWEIYEDGSTHLMTSGEPPDSNRQYTLASRTAPDSEVAHSDVNAYPCSECGMCFSEVLHLESHLRVHSIAPLFACTECGKSFTTSSELGAHIKVHSGEKLFACSECGKCFMVKSNLLAHKAIHIGEKPFACAECGRRFALKSSLDTHMSIHALEKPYACSVCGKCFTSSARLAFHQTTHVGEKTYECDECGKVFTASGSLNRHKRTHTGEKPYACRICGKCFNRETNLYRHQIIHTR